MKGMTPYIYPGLKRYSDIDELNRLVLITNRLFSIDITERCKKEEYVKARQFLCMFAGKRGFSTTEIGKAIRRNHSSVVHMLHKIESHIKLYRDVREEYNNYVKAVSKEL